MMVGEGMGMWVMRKGSGLWDGGGGVRGRVGVRSEWRAGERWRRTGWSRTSRDGSGGSIRVGRRWWAGGRRTRSWDRGSVR